jgi:hypothetical protein
MPSTAVAEHRLDDAGRGAYAAKARHVKPASQQTASARVPRSRPMRISRRGARAVVAVLASTVALAAFVAPVAATTPKHVTIVSHVTFNSPDPNYGDFEATGQAADSGLICRKGTFVDTYLQFADHQYPDGLVRLLVRKEFTCDDGSGTFSGTLAIKADFNTGIESFVWSIRGETGRYRTLLGGGRGSTVGVFDGFGNEIANTNTYDGLLVR